MFLCQVCLVVTHTAFVLGAVYFKYKVNHEDEVHQINPVVFAFVREASAGTIMCIMTYMRHKEMPKKSDLLGFALLGTLMYLNQLFYILGVELSGVIVAACMAPATPVFTAAVAIGLGNEQLSVHKAVGILLASTGSMCMVAGGSENQLSLGSDKMAGNAFLLMNTMAMALYYVFSKPYVKKYPPLAVTAWAYLVAAFCMGLTSIWYNMVYGLNWILPADAYGPLVYWVVVCSVCGYNAIAWSMTHLPATQVAAFICLHPLIGAALGFLILGESLTIWDLGAIGVLVGLVLVNRDFSQRKTKVEIIPHIEVLNKTLNR